MIMTGTLKLIVGQHAQLISEIDSETPAWIMYNIISVKKDIILSKSMLKFWAWTMIFDWCMVISYINVPTLFWIENYTVTYSEHVDHNLNCCSFLFRGKGVIFTILLPKTPEIRFESLSDQWLNDPSSSKRIFTVICKKNNEKKNNNTWMYS
jgi:hypothetical protein